MSETETAPQGGPTGEPAVDDPTASAPAGQSGAATEAEPNAEPTEETQKPSRADRRIAAMSARLAEQGRELDALRRAAHQPPRQPEAMPQTPEELERLVEQRAEEIVATRAAQETAERFHAEGRRAHADWTERCQSLMQMGADAQLSMLLVEMPEGARVAGALADDPEALERIVAIKTERGRAISLGMYAAALAAKPVPPVRRTSNAPAPIRPLSGGQARAEPNEHTMTSEQLVEHYSREAMRARGL